jgi:hypothetical protein
MNNQIEVLRKAAERVFSRECGILVLEHSVFVVDFGTKGKIRPFFEFDSLTTLEKFLRQQIDEENKE